MKRPSTPSRLIGATALLFVGTASSFAATPEVTQYTYDALGRLVEVDRTGGPRSGKKTTYEYDDVGNIKRQKTV